MGFAAEEQTVFSATVLWERNIIPDSQEKSGNN
jgi:hypothetical protein